MRRTRSECRVLCDGVERTLLPVWPFKRTAPKPFKKTIYLQFFCRKGSLSQRWPRSRVMHLISAELHSSSALSQCGRRPPGNVSLTPVYLEQLLKQQRLLTPPPNLRISDGAEDAQILASRRSHQPVPILLLITSIQAQIIAK